MTDLSRLDDQSFTHLIRDILIGLGWDDVVPLPLHGSLQLFRQLILRESTDGMFRTEEVWLCGFVRAPHPLARLDVQPLLKAVDTAEAGHVLLVVFGDITSEAEDELRDVFTEQNVRLVLLSGELACSLASDYSDVETPPPEDAFSFLRLRRHARERFHSAPWRQNYQSVNLLSSRLLPLHHEDAALAEVDIFRATAGGSCLLLGDPGAGKTTSLLALGDALATVGPRMPVYIPLGRYRGNFSALLCEALAPDAEAVRESVARQLLASGCLVLLLDGINEVHDHALHARLMDEINALTDPQQPTNHSCWVVAGRVYDYDQDNRLLHRLEERRWAMQPLTADLIYSFLEAALGTEQGRAVYEELDRGIRELCNNPLLLSMLVTVYQKTGKAPAGRGELYGRFTELMLTWGEERDVGGEDLVELARLLPGALTPSRYRGMARRLLTSLAEAMPATEVSWQEACREVALGLKQAHDPISAADRLLKSLTRRGLLRLDPFHRVSFCHHTVQEYFQARGLVERGVDSLFEGEELRPGAREILLLASGFISNPGPVIDRVLHADPLLAFEILRERPDIVASRRANVARELWEGIQAPGVPVGSRRRQAIAFRRLAVLAGQSAEDLAREIDAELGATQQAKRLLRFNHEVGAPPRRRRSSDNRTHVPEGLLFATANDAYYAGDYPRAVHLYTRYIRRHPRSSNAYHNRALCFDEMNEPEKAWHDYRKALKLANEAERKAVTHTYYACSLRSHRRTNDALRHLRLAVRLNKDYAPSHAELASLLEKADPEGALKHLEQAVLLDNVHDDQERLRYYDHLARLQEQLGQRRQAMAALRQMIFLAPTSAEVRSWKTRIARLRQEIDGEERKQSIRVRLQEQGDLPLPRLTVELFRAAGFQLDDPNPKWLRPRRRDGQHRMLVLMLNEPGFDPAHLPEALQAVPAEHQDAEELVVFTAAEQLTADARRQLAAFQEKRTLAVITSLEARYALLRSDHDCADLIHHALTRAREGGADPFACKGVLRVQTEFFGRGEILEQMTSYVRTGQQFGLYGVHKIGKTSLLEVFRRRMHLSMPEMTFVKVELDSGRFKKAADLYRKVLMELPGWSGEDINGNLTAAEFGEALTAFHRRRERQHAPHRLLLVVDEYNVLIPDGAHHRGLENYLEALAVLKALHQEGWLLLLPCGKSADLSRQASWGTDENPFFHLLHPCYLGPLSRKENDDLMETLGARAGLTFTPEGLEQIYAETGGHPTLSRDLGSVLLRGGRGTVDAIRIRRALDGYMTDPSQLVILRGIYERRMNADERQIAWTIAVSGAKKEEELFPDGDVERRRQVRDALENLLATHVLLRREDGWIDHRYGLLRRVIQQEKV